MSENVTPKLTAKQRAAIRELVSGANYRQTAAAVGITERTLARWRDTEAFASELQRQATLATRDAATRLSGGLSSMLDVLQDVALDEEQPGAVRSRAASFWLSHQVRLVELAEVERRLEALEAAILR